MDESKERAPSPSEEVGTKGRGEPPTKGRKGTRPRPADDEDETRPPSPSEHLVKNTEKAKAHIRDALSELRGGSRPGMTRAERSLNAALELL